MPDPKFQKIKLLKIWEILNRKTDEQHPITTQELIAELNLLGITADRRTIYTDIDSLQEFGYEIQNKRRNHDMVYWLPKRQFDLPEIKIIMDCIYSSKFVTASKTEDESGLMLPIEDLGLSARTANALINNEIRTVRDLVVLSESDLKELKGFGAKALDEVREKLTELKI